MEHLTSFVVFLEISVSFLLVSTMAMTSPGTGTASGSCMSASSCTASGEALSEAINNQDFDAACRLIKPSYKCLKEAIADCRKRGIFTEEQLDSMEQGYKSLEPMLQEYCSDNDNKTPNCFQMTSCLPDNVTMERVQMLVDDHDFAAACRLIRPPYECILSAYEDCKKSNFITEETLNELEGIISPFKKNLDMYCPSESAADSVQHIQHTLLILPLMTLLCILPNSILSVL